MLSLDEQLRLCSILVADSAAQEEAFYELLIFRLVLVLLRGIERLRMLTVQIRMGE